MKLFARYLLAQYLKVLFLCLICFIALLLVSRLQQITKIASFGAPPSYVLRFALLQIPYILPIALPISCLISSWLLSQKLSANQELVALRSSGCGLVHILSPLLGCALLLSIGVFYLTSEVATRSHSASRQIIYEFSQQNPLALLQGAGGRGLFVRMEPIKNGESAQNVVVAPNKDNILIAKRIDVSEGEVRAHLVTVASHGERRLLLENQKEMVADMRQLAHMWRQKGWKIAADHLPMRFLRARIATSSGKVLQKSLSEIVRRVTIGIATLSFTLLGFSFGLRVGREARKTPFFLLLGLGTLALVTFFIGNEFDHSLPLAFLFFLVPHLLIALAALVQMRRITLGVAK